MPIGAGQDGRSAVGGGDPRHVKPGDTILIVAQVIEYGGDQIKVKFAERGFNVTFWVPARNVVARDVM